jgi:DNA-binding MarR family transcriptional regulator
MARMTYTSPHNATTQLRALNARGLIVFRREKMRVIYRAEANQSVDYAPELLATLKTCYEQSMSFETVIRMATAFTHERRIEIIRALYLAKQSSCELLDSTSMNASPLARHLEKLEDRGFVSRVKGAYRIATPGNPLGRTLLKIVRG